MRHSLTLLLFLTSFLTATDLFSQYRIEGSVYDSKDRLILEGAHLFIPELNRGAYTDPRGDFSIRGIDSGQYTLVVRYLGFDNKEMKLNIRRNENLQIFLDRSSGSALSDEVIVSATRLRSQSPGTSITLQREEIEKVNLGQDLPMLLEYTPSVVSASDAGAGVGYTNMRIRGSDQSRINVTLNGIPVNDPESMGVFWVNLPDLASSAEDIQIQRGVGTSTNGAGAFGASVNIRTNQLQEDPYGEINSSAGSFNTFKNTLRFGTGLIKDRFTVDGRISRITSDGFIDRASSDLTSFYLSGGYYDDKTIIRANVLYGREKTYQAWYGVDEFTLPIDRSFNSAGTDFGAKSGDPYDNEVDNYGQDYYQLLINRELTNRLSFNGAGFYTRGAGYFEQYKVGQSFAAYGLDNLTIGDSTITSTDLIRRRWLDNDFYGFTYGLNYRAGNQWDAVLGGAWTQYQGDHFGNLQWLEHSSNSSIRDEYYNSSSIKNDFNIYGKLNFNPINQLGVFIDLQYRKVGYAFGGTDNDLRLLNFSEKWHFFNPKAGFQYRINPEMQLNVAFGIGQREPTRDDIINNLGGLVKPELMRNLEVGYRYNPERGSWGINLFLMHYLNQLVNTGELDDVGGLIRRNVPKSYRLGTEISALYEFDKWEMAYDLTFSLNRIAEYEEVVYTFDENYVRQEQLTQRTTYRNTDIAFSPNIIGNLRFTWHAFKGFDVTLFNKGISRQNMDNTSRRNRSLDPYLVNDIQLSYTITAKVPERLVLTLRVNNFTNRRFEPNGYTFTERYLESGSGQLTDNVAYNYFYPQAGVNVMGGISLRF